MNKRISVIKFLIMTIGLSFIFNSWAKETIDISDLLLKVQEPAMFHDLGKEGFAIYDIGEEKLKFFSWDLKLIRGMKIKKGEGPGEIKSFILSAFLLGKKLHLLAFMDNKIDIYDEKGSFLKSIKIDFIPKEMVYCMSKLHIFKLSFNAGEESFLLGKLINPENGETIKDIILKHRLASSKTLGGNPALLGLSSNFDVAENGNIFLLISSANVLIEVDENGKLIRRTDLPYKERKEVKSIKDGDKVETVMSILDWYHDMRAFGNYAYTCFLKHIKKDKYGSNVYQTHVMKILEGKKYTEKIIDGNFVFIGENKGKVFLFNTDDYQIVSFNLNEW